MKKALIVILAIALVGFVATFFAFRQGVEEPDAVLIHFAAQSAIEADTPQEAIAIQTEFLMQSFEYMDTARRERDNALQLFVYLIIFTLTITSILLYLYYKQRILAPFYKLQSFASRVASGNLDIPLEMDKSNLFGAFTESFDLMREELRIAKENEYKANQSKKELVASLSHDIKTPLASIKSGVELLLVKASSDKEKEMFNSINVKLEQIDDLVTNMFHATLEEMQALSVTPIEILSTEIPNLLRGADYNKKTSSFRVPNCIVLADLMRLRQVFDNVISNSYKYANTSIAISALIEEQYLIIDIQDFGSGVLEEELPLLFNKFYRGKNTEKLSGYGLGLYISKYFMTEMLGGIECYNNSDGFAVRLLLKLA
ncbi:MAG: HAMP domain-containing histidine kinase [Defluviitaleaceae bacterium]|nr:HAMP domain-containing histidine kinase [Defluviitaleaceae bacterium]